MAMHFTDHFSLQALFIITRKSQMTRNIMLDG
jgi:hypothetical protein